MTTQTQSGWVGLEFGILEEFDSAAVYTSDERTDLRESYRSMRIDDDRLKGTSFSKSGGLELLIDKATGKYEADAKELFDFIRDRIFPFVLAVALVELGLDPWRHLP